MKKILAIVLSAVMLMGAMLTLTSCDLFGGGPKPDVKMSMKKMAAALEDEDYEVQTQKEPSPGVKQALYARNEDGDYLYITWYEDAALAKLEYEQMKLQDEYDEKEAKLELKAMKKYLDLYEKDLEDEVLEEYEEELEEAEEALEEDDDYCFGRKGNVTWKGTKSAVEDSKG